MESYLNKRPINIQDCPKSSFRGQDSSSKACLPSTSFSHLSLRLKRLHMCPPKTAPPRSFSFLLKLYLKSSSVVLLVTSLINSRGYMPALFSLPASIFSVYPCLCLKSISHQE